MKVAGETTFDAPRDTVWRVLIRPESMAGTLPGVERFDVHDEDRWTAAVKIRLGLVSVRMPLEVELVERREPEFARLEARGRGVGGSLAMDTCFELRSAGSRTEMRWEADVTLSGPGGAVGERLLRPLVDRQVRKVMDSLEGEVTSGAAEPEESSRGTIPRRSPRR